MGDKMNLENKRIIILKITIILVFIFLIFYLFYIQISKNEYYKNIVSQKANITIEGTTAPRGRILDRNYNVIVDNIQINEIVYNASNTIEEQINIAKTLSNLLTIEPILTETQKEEYYFLTTDKQTYEYMLLENMENYEINEEEAYIYYLMNNGYSYEDKLIKTKVTDEEYALVAESLDELNGISLRTNWERYYPYGDTLKSILGTVGDMPESLLDYYENTDYNITDKVGISYLEMQYDSYLKGVNEVYLLNDELTILESGRSGYDIVLSIDINLQLEIEKIIEEEMLKAKNEANTQYFEKTYALITDPNTGEILAMSGKQIIEENGEYTFIDSTNTMLTNPLVVGSAIKGASHIVGYNTGAITFGETHSDMCLKFYNLNEKCSWKSLGVVDDITAIKYSANTYQYHTVLDVGQSSYNYNGNLNLADGTFDLYRNTFYEFGLGVLTEIDLPFESTGYKGTRSDDYLLLDYAIGQYDTYTALQLGQYISTIANDGSRMKLNLLNEVINNEEIIYTYEPIILNTVSTQDTYMDRVQLGFSEVMQIGGTGSNYIDRIYSPAGKTGTSQTFYDTDNNGIIDTETISSTFVGYAPADDPIVTFTVITPDIGHFEGSTDYRTYVNKRISYAISNKFFEIYK